MSINVLYEVCFFLFDKLQQNYLVIQLIATCDDYSTVFNNNDK